MTLTDKIVMITGAGRGIGRALAIGFCNDGAHVVGFGRTEEDLVETVNQCNGKMHYVVGDITLEKDVEHLLSETLQRYGKVDILINNAGICPNQRFLEIPYSSWSKTVEVNLMGVALCCKKVLPSMLAARYGRIITITSDAIEAPWIGSSDYATSKAGVSMLTKILAMEIDRTLYPNVLINDLIPGATQTGMCDFGQEAAAVYPHARFLATLPAGSYTGTAFFKSRPYQFNSLRFRTKKFLRSIARQSWHWFRRRGA
jgi:NAD(P)-dependent dehydrogenase (short-subunit alcohol dehydrogenase family)